jgi:poly-beta-1,6-N-acetyl-D-glucosamine synthase
MNTLRSLDAQQVKWNFGAIELMWPGQRGDTKGQPFHPNLRLRWFEHMSMVLNIITRLMFFSLLLASLSIHAFVFSPWWLVPPVVAILLNYRVARSMHYGHRRDILFAVLLLPAEIYMWIRIGHFLRAWTKFASRKQTDNWAAQAKAERGSGNSYLYPFAIALLGFVAAAAVWFQVPIDLQSSILAVGWPILGVITVAQTFWMGIKILRNYRGYTV